MLYTLSMKYLRVLLPVLVVGIVALAPHAAYAASATFFGPIVPPECHCDAATNGGQQSAPDIGCVLQTIDNAMNFAISIGVIIFVLVTAYAGLLLIFSPMNSHNRELARTVILNAVIGLLIAMSAWLMVDFIMKSLYNEKFGPWYSILGSGNQCLSVITPPASGTAANAPATPTFQAGQKVECALVAARPDDRFPGTVTSSRVVDDGDPSTPSADMVTVAFDGNTAEGNPIGSAEILASLCRVQGAASTPPGDGTTPPTTEPGDWQSFFGLQSDAAQEVGDASPALQSMLSCMVPKLQSNKPNPSAISSISDIELHEGKTWADCKAGQCQHCGGTGSNACPGGGSSYHYGGTKCGNQSYAVDFSADPGTSAANALSSAAQQCGATKEIAEGSGPAHLHIQVGSCN